MMQDPFGDMGMGMGMNMGGFGGFEDDDFFGDKSNSG